MGQLAAANASLPYVISRGCPDEARVQAFQGRLVAAGRGAGLRLYDWGYRLEVARALGDWPYARAVVAQMGTDYKQLRRGDSLYLMGLAWTLIALRGDGPTTGGLDAAAYGLLARLFRVLGPGGEVLQPGGHCAEPVSREPRGRDHTRPRVARCFR